MYNWQIDCFDLCVDLRKANFLSCLLVSYLATFCKLHKTCTNACFNGGRQTSSRVPFHNSDVRSAHWDRLSTTHKVYSYNMFRSLWEYLQSRASPRGVEPHNKNLSCNSRGGLPLTKSYLLTSYYFPSLVGGWSVNAPEGRAATTFPSIIILE